MIYREFAKTGFKVSAVGMGTYYDPAWIALASVLKIRSGAEKKLKAIRTGLDNGLNLIDTAEVYQSEPLVGEAIKGYRRDNLFIATKVSFPWNFSRHGVERACRRSLSRLGTSYIDLYQLHYPYRLQNISEVMKGLEKLVLDGKVRAIGVSNFSLSQMQEAESALSKVEVSSNQVSYSLLHRQPEVDLVPYCERNKKAILAYFPLAHGRLARSGNAAMERVMKQTGATSAAQIALNWLVQRSAVVFPIPRASRPERVVSNVHSLDWKLGPAELEILESIGKDINLR